MILNTREHNLLNENRAKVWSVIRQPGVWRCARVSREAAFALRALVGVWVCLRKAGSVCSLGCWWKPVFIFRSRNSREKRLWGGRERCKRVARSEISLYSAQRKTCKTCFLSSETKRRAGGGDPTLPSNYPFQIIPFLCVFRSQHWKFHFLLVYLDDLRKTVPHARCLQGFGM